MWRYGDDSAVCLKEGASSLWEDDEGPLASSRREKPPERWSILDLEDDEEEDDEGDSE